MLEIYIHRLVPSSPHPGLAYLSSFLSLGHNQVHVPPAPLLEPVTDLELQVPGFQTIISHAGHASGAGPALLPQPCPAAGSEAAAGPTSAPGKLGRAGLAGHAGTSCDAWT